MTRNLGVLGNVYARAGRRSEALRVLGELTTLSRQRYVPPVYLAMVYMGLGNRSRALDLLEQTVTDRLDWAVQLKVEPDFDPLRRESRFAALLARVAGQAGRAH
jgi:hypothetical protein